MFIFYLGTAAIETSAMVSETVELQQLMEHGQNERAEMQIEIEGLRAQLACIGMGYYYLYIDNFVFYFWPCKCCRKCAKIPTCILCSIFYYLLLVVRQDILYSNQFFV